MLQSQLRGEAFRGNPNVPPTPSMDLDAFLMWGSKLILFAKKICACVIYGDWMNLQVEWLRLQDVVMPEAMAVHGRSRPRSMYNEHQSFYYVIETSTTYEKPTNSGSLIQDDPRLKFFICFDPVHFFCLKLCGWKPSSSKLAGCLRGQLSSQPFGWR